MTYLEELWRSLFNKDITVLEQEVMKGVGEKFERDDAVTLLSAITVRMLFLVLIEHKASPFTLMHGFARTMEENRRSISLVNKTYGELLGEMGAFKADIHSAQGALREIREYAHAKAGYDAFRGYYPLAEREPEGMSRRLIITVITGSLAAGFLGSVVGAMIILS